MAPETGAALSVRLTEHEDHNSDLRSSGEPLEEARRLRRVIQPKTITSFPAASRPPRPTVKATRSRHAFAYSTRFRSQMPSTSHVLGQNGAARQLLAISIELPLPRRARSLLPALLLMLVFVAILASVVVHRGTYPALRLDSLATLLYVSNWHFVLVHSNYFNLADSSSPLIASEPVRWATSKLREALTGKGISEAETGAMIENFIRELVPRLHRPDGGALLEGATLSKNTP